MVLHSHESGGAEKHALLLMRGLRERGHAVTYAGPRDSWLRRQCDDSGIPFLSAPMRGTYDLASAAKLAAYAKLKRVDLIHGHLTRGAFYAGLSAKWSGTPSVGTAHSTNARRHFHRMDRVIAVSIAVKNFLASHGMPPEKIALVYNGVPSPRILSSEERREIREKLGLSDENRALCMAARFIPDKGQDLAAEAFKRLDDPQARLFFIGKAEGEWRDRIVEQVRSSGIERSVSFLGHREDVYDLLGAMDLYLAPSRREALSLSLLEALAVGLPVIASDVGGNPEIVADGENGSLVRSEDVEALTEAMRRMLSEPERAEEMGRRGRLTFERAFTEAKMIEDTIAVYRDLLGLAPLPPTEMPDREPMENPMR